MNRRGWFALLGVTATVACGERGSSVRGDLTGVDLLVHYEPAAGLDQLRVSGTLAGGGEAFAPGLVPETPRPLVSGEDSLLLLLPDELAGGTLTLHVDGLVLGSAAVAGETSVLVVEEELVDAEVTIGTPTPTPTPAAVCSNGVDDDGDGQADFPGDAGCSDASDDDERGPGLVCDDGIDQDGDTFFDFPDDPGCNNANDASELGPPSRECDNGTDDDDDTFVDYPDDPQCFGPEDTDEAA